MKIGKTIKDLRRDKNMTQEALAEKLNISVSAVSQWEMGKTMPDISMIPLLVDVFNVTSDELLGINSEEVERRVEEYIQKNNELYSAWKHEEMILLMKKAYKEFPSNMKIVNAYAFALITNLFHNMPVNLEQLDLCIELDKKILDRSLDDNLRYAAIYRLCSCFSKKGDKESAKHYAQKLPNGPHMCKQNIIRKYDLLPNEEKIPAYQEDIAGLVWILGEYVISIADPNYQNQSCSFSVEKRIHILEQMIAVLKAIYSEDNACDINYDLYEYYRIIGALYLFGKDTEKALDYFEIAYEYAVKFMCSYKEGKCYSSPLMQGCKVRPQSDWNKGANTALESLYVRFTTQSRYETLKDNSRFIALKEKLQANIVN